MKEKIKFVMNLTSDKIRSIDRYSKNITFSFRGKESFSTLFGGQVSIFTYILLMIYAYSILKIMFERNSTKAKITGL